MSKKFKCIHKELQRLSKKLPKVVQVTLFIIYFGLGP